MSIEIEPVSKIVHLIAVGAMTESLADMYAAIQTYRALKIDPAKTEEQREDFEKLELRCADKRDMLKRLIAAHQAVADSFAE